MSIAIFALGMLRVEHQPNILGCNLFHHLCQKFSFADNLPAAFYLRTIWRAAVPRSRGTGQHYAAPSNIILAGPKTCERRPNELRLAVLEARAYMRTISLPAKFNKNYLTWREKRRQIP